MTLQPFMFILSLNYITYMRYMYVVMFVYFVFFLLLARLSVLINHCSNSNGGTKTDYLLKNLDWCLTVTESESNEYKCQL